MVSTAAELACPILVLIGWIGTIVAVAHPAWETTDLDTVQLRTNFKFNGLWVECQQYASGQTSCETFRSFFAGLPVSLQAARGFSLFSLLVALVSFVVCLMAVTKCPCSSGQIRSRNRTRLIGGILGIVAGISLLAGVSWYAVDVLREYFDLLRFTVTVGASTELLVIGPALFIGWTAAGLEVVGGLVAICISCGDSEDEPDRYIPAKQPNREYV